ncbi:MAG: hypothetical protein IJV47_05495, partial [Candidatus Methanomethylophilaceae archaeon]|nr:hypothetical protein [Candidatus Methanomethylophilaceae archaeon]
PSKVRHIVMDAGVLGDVEPSQVQRIGKLIVGAIMATEIRGDRVRLDVCTTTVCCRSRIMMLSVNAKKETERMDLARFLFWCASPAVNRGVSFNWRATHPDFPSENLLSGMGYSIGSRNTGFAKEIYKEVFPEGTIMLNMMDLILRTERMSDDDAVDYIKELMME